LNIPLPRDKRSLVHNFMALYNKLLSLSMAMDSKKGKISISGLLNRLNLLLVKLKKAIFRLFRKMPKNYLRPAKYQKERRKYGHSWTVLSCLMLKFAIIHLCYGYLNKIKGTTVTDSRNLQYRVKEFITFSSAVSQTVPKDRAEQTISKSL
jgi:hypothetical protein